MIKGKRSNYHERISSTSLDETLDLDYSAISSLIILKISIHYFYKQNKAILPLGKTLLQYRNSTSKI